ncbi:TetR/AcrR family transcriptional regulator [Rhabdothermincola salaria]|uniref:TetR/AcrR family transcriptional regulator n=1 Tax=Rhabdothermincola salaria TaxID=2903142 RepID=UPI001E2B1938|nr:TetR/AcrR family transcriptional regulator [Rhabdothermincola salaria]MCD9625213.1 TetR/AcrR family transcriptional regulator [Rhabdothermincola salaria]
MTARRDKVDRTRLAILDAAYRLWLAEPYDEVGLEHIAEAAGVSRQTVHRQFGSKDDLFVEVIDWRRPFEDAAAAVPEPGDVAGIVSVTVDRYERMGDANVRLAAMEGRIDAVDYFLAQGREAHMAGLERGFADHLPRRGSKARTQALLALYGATDLMVWKLLRRDLDQSRSDTEAVMRRLVEGVLLTLPPRPEGNPR